ncbi:PepSY domain-containing protein [Halorussus sp. MSC15.2]|uniref:PepSY domain-containing protein n=1 Tax=Halorussus sp. MSC15.2 TaxID=2283638 RepID=UPI0013D459B1|nr:PepSY domain-containing protein [Halorussus sp. MSC15.2]NEU57808.1 PepSY domain-containing protein [Halorussus sp. MSC15.2]
MTRYQRFVLGLVVLLVVGAPIGTAAPSVAFESPEEGATSPVSTVRETARNVTAVDAMVAAENETNGTAIGVERERKDGTPVWEVEVLRRDAARFEVDVHAETGEIRNVEGGGVLGGGASEGLLPANRTRNVSEMRSAIEAVGVARNRSATVTNVSRVSLEIENSTLVYEVEYSTPDGEHEVHVAAVPRT